MPTAPATLIESARRALGPVGAFLPVQMTSAPPVEQQRDAARRLERAGYPTAWTNEAVGGKDALVQIAVLLAATERMVFGTGIANIWARPPQTAHAAAALPAQAYPGRFVRGLGVGYPEQAASVGQRVRQSAAHDAFTPTWKVWQPRPICRLQTSPTPASSRPTAPRCSRWPASWLTGRCQPCLGPTSPPRPGGCSARTSSW